MIIFYLQQLKTRLQARFLGQVRDYSCQVEGLVTQHDKENVCILQEGHGSSITQITTVYKTSQKFAGA